MIYLAIDFGGGSGRVIAGKLENGKLEMELIHRFPNRQVRLGNHVYWDFLALFEDMKTGLKMAGAKGLKVDGIAIDTWGVDFGLIDKDGNLLGNPVCYRDARTKGMPEEVFKQIDPSAHYAINGTQVMEINTLFQLYSLKKANSPQLEKAAHLLFTPDLFSYYLTGEANNEYTIASTSELLNATTKDWDWETIDQLGLPRHIFGKIVMPGTVRGKLRRDIAEETGLGEVDVIAVGSHDTASAVAAVPATEDEYPMAFISSGTWSLLGVEIEKPILTEEARKAEFTNEGGIGGRITFLQNITGLWIMQRLMAEWKENGEEQQFDIILPQAEEAHINAIIPVDDAAFQNPASHAAGYHRLLRHPSVAGSSDQGRNRALRTPVTGCQVCRGYRSPQRDVTATYQVHAHHRRRLTEQVTQPSHLRSPGRTSDCGSYRGNGYGQHPDPGTCQGRNQGYRRAESRGKTKHLIHLNIYPTNINADNT